MKHKKSKSNLLRLKTVTAAVLLGFGVTFAQNVAVTGTVTDHLTGDPLIGVSVAIQGASTGTITDFNGKYSLSVASGQSVIFSYVGYVAQTVKVGNQRTINVQLVEDVESLNEVVVVGYGVQKKSDVTGSMSRVTAATIEERPVQNALQALQGKATGVDIASNNRPGELGVIRVRGNRSITASNEPLYVVDGIPLQSGTDPAAFGSFSVSSGQMADINPADIESIEILKDASATAIYGVRGANGVVLITTKKGSKGRTSITYDGAVSFSKITPTTDYMNAGELLDYRRQSAVTGGTYGGAYGNAPDPARDRALWLGTQPYMMPQINRAYQLNTDGTPVLRAATPEEKAMGYADQVPVYDGSKMETTDWGALAARTGVTDNHLLSLSAGTEISNLYFSLGYLNQQAAMKDQDYVRYTANINGDITPSKWFKAGMGINVSHSIQNYGMVYNDGSNAVAKDSYGLAMNLMPWTPAFNEDGSVLIINDGDAAHNILRDIDQAWNEYRYWGARMSSFAEITLTPWLKFRTNFGANFRKSRNGTFIGENNSNTFGFESTAPGTAYNNQQTRLSWALENLIYINKTFNGIHNLGVTLLHSAENYRSESLYIRVYNSTFPTAFWYNVGAADNSKYQPGSSYYSSNMESYMARINYGLMDKYLATLTWRRDGTSVFPEKKWDNFYSAALAWRLEQEEFIKNIDWINQLKLRAGYGMIGNAAVASYTAMGSMTDNFAKMPFGKGNTAKNTNGAKTNTIPNSDLGWEKTSTWNVGIDFSVLKNRISGSVEFYNATTSDLLMKKTIPAITGYALILANVGKTQNKGFEVTLNTVNVRTPDFTWQTDWVFSLNREKILELAGGVDFDSNGPWKVGEPINVFYNFKYDRMWQNTTEDQRLMAIYKAAGNLTFLPGQYKVVDQDLVEVPEGTAGSKTVTLASGEKVTYMDNGFGKFDNDDRVFYNKTPKWTGGLTNTFTYQNLSLSVFAFFRVGNYYYGLTQTIGRRVEPDTWTPENTGAKFAQPTTATRTNTYDGARQFASGSMAIIRNISVQYNLPKSWLKKATINSAQIYGQIHNPFIWGGELVKAGINPDDITGWDDNRLSGGQTNNTVITRNYVVGLRVNL